MWQRSEEDGEVDLRALRRPSLIPEVGMEKHFTSLVRVHITILPIYLYSLIRASLRS